LAGEVNHGFQAIFALFRQHSLSGGVAED
jgi:hypothetical protein